MSRDRFEAILRQFHVVDNTTRAPGTKKLFEIAPLLNHLLEVCRSIPSEENQNVDGHIQIPFKGTSCIKQYVKKKPKKWVYKVFMRCGASGLLHDFAVYVGKETCPEYGIGFSGDIVLHLCEDLQSNMGHRLFCHNWFTSTPLFKTLEDKGVWHTGVVQADRTNSCPLLNKAELQQLDRGSYESAVDTKNELVPVRWYDKKLIIVFSGEHSFKPVEMCKRWSKHLRRQIEILRPNLINMYNESMGGVDLFGMLIALYRVNVRSQRGYIE